VFAQRGEYKKNTDVKINIDFAPFDCSVSITEVPKSPYLLSAFLNQQVLIVDVLILASAALSQLRSQYRKEIQILCVSVVQV